MFSRLWGRIVETTKIFKQQPPPHFRLKVIHNSGHIIGDYNMCYVMLHGCNICVRACTLYIHFMHLWSKVRFPLEMLPVGWQIKPLFMNHEQGFCVDLLLCVFLPVPPLHFPFLNSLPSPPFPLLPPLPFPPFPSPLPPSLQLSTNLANRWYCHCARNCCICDKVIQLSMFIWAEESCTTLLNNCVH